MAHKLEHASSNRGLSGRLSGFWRQQHGAEVVQFAIMLPIVLGVVLTILNAFQLVALRSRMRSTASQMAQYVSAYAVPPDQERAPMPDLCDGLVALLDTSFVNTRTNLGDPVVPEANLYVINDPMNPEYEGNSTHVNCRTLADRLQPNQQFAVELNATVNWLWVGQSDDVWWRWAQDVFTFSMTERAFGVVPGEPFFILRDPTYTNIQGPGGCTVIVNWVVEGSFLPDRYEIYRNNDAPGNRLDVIDDPLATTATVELPAGQSSTILIKAICGAREEELQTPPIGCNLPQPTPTP